MLIAEVLFFGIKASAKCINVNAIAYAIFM